MTHDNQPDQDELDEIASAVVDDEATAEERDRVSADAQLRERVETFTQLSRAVGTVPPPDSAAREATLAAVLAASGSAPASGTTAEQGSSDGTVVPLMPPAGAVRRRSKRFVPAVAAAVIVLLAIPALLIALNRDSGVNDVALSRSDDSAASGSLDTGAEASASDVSSTTTGPSTESSTTFANGSAPVPDLGTVDTPEALDATVKQQLSATAASPSDGAGTATTTTVAQPGASTPTSIVATAPPASGTPCEAAVRDAVSGLGGLVLTATATYQGNPVQVYGFDDPTSDATMVVVADLETCAVVQRLTA